MNRILLKKRPIIQFILFVGLVSFSNLLNAQTAPDGNLEVITEWKPLGEANNRVDVSYSIVKCDSVEQIHLQVFNESPNAQTTNMVIHVTNIVDGATFSKSISFSSPVGALTRAECTSGGDTELLKINVPNNYDSSQLTVEVTFN